ncbi:MAG TPA: EthD domain-containing protein [Acidimicrobiales bacterium]|nr:EthD domain-containing protein [Acidimicrobiales bacterium]
MNIEGPKTLMVLLEAQGGLAAAVGEELARLERELGEDGAVVAMDQLPDAPGDQAAWDVVVKLVGPDVDRLIRCVDGLDRRLGDTVGDAEVLAGTDRTVFTNPVPPDAVTLLFAMYGGEGVSREEFAIHWHEDHAELVRHNPFVRSYHQLHADAEATRRAVDATGLGSGDLYGVAECDFVSAATFGEMLATELIEREAVDILSISDVTRNTAVLTRRR